MSTSVTTPGTTSTSTSAPTVRTRGHRVGQALEALVVAFLVFDVVGKLAQPQAVVDATTDLGFGTDSITTIGVLLGVGVVLHLVPRTSFVGAIWITAYLGGAVCANYRADQPLLSTVLSPVYVALLLWGAFYLRSATLRELVRSGS